MTSIRPNESVSSRAVVDGITSVAAIRVTPTTLIEATIVAAIARANRRVDQPDVDAVDRGHLGVERHEQQPLVEQDDERGDADRDDADDDQVERRHARGCCRTAPPRSSG